MEAGTEVQWHKLQFRPQGLDEKSLVVASFGLSEARLGLVLAWSLPAGAFTDDGALSYTRSHLLRCFGPMN